MSEQVRAVLYAAKSTEDKHGSIPTQLEDCRKAAEDEGREVIADYRDEAKSGYSGNRGPGLSAAQEHAEQIGAELWVQHTDRLARGDGKAAKHLVEHVLWSWRAGVTLRSVQDDDACRDLLYAVVNGQRNHEDSARKSAATRAGLLRRKKAGKPVGPIPLGYTVETKVVEDQVITKRVIDSATVGTVERIFDMVESGKSFGDIARILNAEGVRTRPRKDHPEGCTWVSRTVRKVVQNDSYAGRNGYSEIIDPDRFDTIQKSLRRLTEVRHGRKPTDPSYFLRGIARCARCGSRLYTREDASGRVYICQHRRQGTGICRDTPPIPATLFEDHVLRHLDAFVGSVESWLGEQVAERDSERQAREAALERHQAKLADLDRERQRHLTEYRKLDGAKAEIALEVIEQIDRDMTETEQQIADGEAFVSERSGPPDVDAALDYYSALVDHIHGRIEQAKGARELNEALSMVVAGLWAEIEEDRERLLVEFELVGQPEVPGFGMDPHRPTLPPRMLHDRMPPEPLTQTRTQTKVNRCLAEGRARLRELNAL